MTPVPPHQDAPTPARRGLYWGLAGLAMTAVAVYALTTTAQAVMPATFIDSAGPLSRITLGHDLSCQVRRADDYAATGDDELFPPGGEPGDCGTFLLVDATPAGTGTFYAPDFGAHTGGTATSGIGVHSNYAFVSESAMPTGSGTAADPFVVVTVVTAGSFTTITETERYVVGQEWYTSTINITNTDTAAHNYRLWRAGDCYLGGDDTGYGYADAPGDYARVACTTLPSSLADRFEMWAPTTPGSRYYHAGYSAVWSWIGGHTTFPDTCECTTLEDNGAGIAWDFAIPAGGTATAGHTLSFSLGLPPNQPPTAAIVFDNSFTSCMDSHVQFLAVVGDTDGSVVSVDWLLGDSTTASGLSLSHVYAVPGTYTVTLIVKDDDGAITTVTASVFSVGDPNCCPTLNPLPDFDIMEGNMIHFTATGDDFEGDALTFTTGAGRPSASSFDPSNGYFFWHSGVGDAGDYTFSITATDGFAHPADGPCGAFGDVFIHVRPRPVGEPAPDADGDGIEDSADNCPAIPNGDQGDADLDGVGDACARVGQEGDGSTTGGTGPLADAADVDRDGIADLADNCPAIPNRGQEDADGDGRGDVCDSDIDGDGVPQAGPVGAFTDNCPTVPNADQQDADGNGVGDACQPGSASYRGDPAGGSLAPAPGSQDESFLARPGPGMSPALLVGGSMLAALVLVGLVAFGLRRRP